MRSGQAGGVDDVTTPDPDAGRGSERAFGDLASLQEMDTAIDQLAHRMANHPQRTVVTDAEATLAGLTARVSDVESRRASVAKEQSRLEAEVGEIEARIARADAQLYGGVVVDHKDLEALQHEIATLRGMQGAIEDRVIEQMELGEPLDQELVVLAMAETAAADALDDGRRTLTADLAELGVELDSLTARRAEWVTRIDPSTLARYESIRAASGGVGAAHLSAGRCDGCHLQLPAVEVDRIRRLPDDEIALCPECGRILVR